MKTNVNLLEVLKGLEELTNGMVLNEDGTALTVQQMQQLLKEEVCKLKSLIGIGGK